jgi:alpha-ketoglutarate-dependent taurine dioxygenase
MAHILAIYDELEVSFPWQKGDVLLVDNVLVAHGRNPFLGERKILVALGQMASFETAPEPAGKDEVR